MKKGLLSAALVLLGVAITPAQANTYTFGWVTTLNANTNLGLSYALTSGSITLTAYGLTVNAGVTNAATAGPDLYAKNDGAGETGLGMTNDPGKDNEISAQLNDGIQIDFSNAIKNAPNANVTLSIGSVQSGEGWALYGSNTLYTVACSSMSLGALGEPLLAGVGPYANATDTVTLPDWGQYDYYTLMATDPGGSNPLANIVLGTVTIATPVQGLLKSATPTPEPATLLMAGTALIALGVVLKKSRKKA